MRGKPIEVACLALVVFGLQSVARAKVDDAANDGFKLTITRDTSAVADAAFTALVDDFSRWYDASHSYSGKKENLSIDLQKHCMLEKLPDGGFVRHMEVVFYQPSKRILRMMGGLGPLQGMGVNGAMTFSVEPNEKEKGSRVTMTYVVCGYSGQQLDKLAPIVNQVLEAQLDGLKKVADSIASDKQ